MALGKKKIGKIWNYKTEEEKVGGIIFPFFFFLENESKVRRENFFQNIHYHCTNLNIYNLSVILRGIIPIQRIFFCLLLFLYF